MASQNISKKRKFVADGLFYAELNEFLMGELGEDGYSGVEVRVTPMRTEVFFLFVFRFIDPITYLAFLSDHHPRHPHPERARRERTAHPRVDLPRPEALQHP